MKLDHDKTHSILAAFLVAMILLLFIVVVMALLQPRGRLSCGSFGAYEDALAAFRAGNTQLDGDHDGRPCEYIKK